jgi:hypothetical protein
MIFWSASPSHEMIFLPVWRHLGWSRPAPPSSAQVVLAGSIQADVGSAVLGVRTFGSDGLLDGGRKVRDP